MTTDDIKNLVRKYEVGIFSLLSICLLAALVLFLYPSKSVERIGNYVWSVRSWGKDIQEYDLFYKDQYVNSCISKFIVERGKVTSSMPTPHSDDASHDTSYFIESPEYGMMTIYLDKNGDYYNIYKYKDTPYFNYVPIPDEEEIDIEKYALKILKECKTLADYEKCFRSGRTTDTSRKWTKKHMKEMLEMMFKASAKESISFSVLISIEQGTSFGELKELIDNFAKAGCLRVVIDYESPWKCYLGN